MRMPEAASISFVFTHLSHAPYPGDEVFCRYSSTPREKQLLNPNTFIPDKGKIGFGLCCQEHTWTLRKVKEGNFLLYIRSSMVFSMHHTNYPQDGQYDQRR